MNNLENTTKTYCNNCNRFLGWMQKDRLTLQAPVTICTACERQQTENKTIIIDLVCTSAIVLAVALSGILALHYII